MLTYSLGVFYLLYRLSLGDSQWDAVELARRERESFCASTTSPSPSSTSLGRVHTCGPDMAWGCPRPFAEPIGAPLKEPSSRCRLGDGALSPDPGDCGRCGPLMSMAEPSLCICCVCIMCMRADCICCICCGVLYPAQPKSAFNHSVTQRTLPMSRRHRGFTSTSRSLTDSHPSAGFAVSSFSWPCRSAWLCRWASCRCACPSSLASVGRHACAVRSSYVAVALQSVFKAPTDERVLAMTLPVH